MSDFYVACYFQRGRAGLSLPPTCETGHRGIAHLPMHGETASFPGMSPGTALMCHPSHKYPLILPEKFGHLYNTLHGHI